MIDYPDQLSAVVFLQGCPWRCRYCQNGELLARKSTAPIPWQKIIQHLQKRTGLLDAVVFSGGEATLQPALAPAIEQVREMGFKVGLHSAGIYPQRLRKLLPLIDWIGLDIKACEFDYPATTQAPGSGTRAWQSLQWVLQGDTPYEIRTTVHPTLIDPAQLEHLAEQLKQSGVRHFSIQTCVTRQCLDERLSSTPALALDTLFLQRMRTDFSTFEFRQN